MWEEEDGEPTVQVIKLKTLLPHDNKQIALRFRFRNSLENQKCLRVEFSMRVSKEVKFHFMNELVRVSYEGRIDSMEDNVTYYDNRLKISVNLEFQQDAKDLYKNIKH